MGREHHQLAVRIQKQQDPSSRARYILLCKDEVDKKKHKRNPFADPFVQLLQTPMQAQEVCIRLMRSVERAGLDVVCTLKFHAPAGLCRQPLGGSLWHRGCNSRRACPN